MTVGSMPLSPWALLQRVLPEGLLLVAGSAKTPSAETRISVALSLLWSSAFPSLPTSSQAKMQGAGWREVCVSLFVA